MAFEEDTYLKHLSGVWGVERILKAPFCNLYELCEKSNHNIHLTKPTGRSKVFLSRIREPFALAPAYMKFMLSS
jgi:hypothetical protein